MEVRQSGFPLRISPSFLTVIVLQRFGAHQPALRRTDEPLPAIWKIVRFDNRIVRYDIYDKIFSALIDELVRLVWREDEGIAGFDRSFSVLVPDDAAA